jgi:hypothetical protein
MIPVRFKSKPEMFPVLRRNIEKDKISRLVLESISGSFRNIEGPNFPEKDFQKNSW